MTQALEEDSDLGGLSFLAHLDLRGSQLSGALPPELCGLSSLACCTSTVPVRPGPWRPVKHEHGGRVFPPVRLWHEIDFFQRDHLSNITCLTPDFFENYE